MAKSRPDPQDSEGAASTPADGAGASAAEDDVKRKFRAALDRKQEMHTDSAGENAGRNGSKIRGAHGTAAHQRQFRRKSG